MKNVSSVKYFVITPLPKPKGTRALKRPTGKKAVLHPSNVKSGGNTKASQDNTTRQFSTLHTRKGLNSPYGFCPEFNCKKKKN